jgi:hypothetical protein
MSRIYRQSAWVIAWLGCSAAVMRADLPFQAGEDSMVRQSLPNDIQPWNEDAIQALLQNRYFTRLWIVQEVRLAPKVYILCDRTWTN